MSSNAPNAMLARLKQHSGPPNAVIVSETAEKLHMLSSPMKKGLDSLFKEVRVFNSESAAS